MEIYLQDKDIILLKSPGSNIKWVFDEINPSEYYPLAMVLVNTAHELLEEAEAYEEADRLEKILDIMDEDGNEREERLRREAAENDEGQER